MNCISRRDKDDKNLFVERKNVKERFNLYSQIVIENHTLHCAHESYSLSQICNSQAENQPCTLRDTNEVVYIGFEFNE